MKKIFGTIAAFLITFSLSAQYTIRGVVSNDQTNEPLEAATISVFFNNLLVTNTLSNNLGKFSVQVNKAGTYVVTAGYISMKTNSASVVAGSETADVALKLEQGAYFLEPLELRAVRAGTNAPFTKQNIDKKTIEGLNLGTDLPTLLDQTPSAVVSSDAGNGVGYTGIRIRGSDNSRINVTMNGIPYNDAESQGSYFVDLPDLTSSLSSIQIQRGVGTSSNGAGAFGATINLATNEFNEKAYGEINNSYGSFNTWKNTVKAGSGLLHDHFTIDARLSKISSDGYVDRASTNLNSFYLSTAWIAKNASLRFNIISGKEKTYQSWNGVPESLLKTNRTYNSVGTEKPGDPYDNETDNYQQDHYQLFYNQALSSKLSFNTALFLTRGKGYYEQYKADQTLSDYGVQPFVAGGTAVTKTDLVRRLWLDNYYYGQILSLQYKNGPDQLTFGGGWNRYDGEHYGQVAWAMVGIPKDYRYYHLDAFKTDINAYTKWQHAFSKRLSAFADVQYRHVDYTMNGFRKNPTVIVKRQFDFINPKAGLTFNNNGWQSYISYALGNKEPNRDDFEAGITQQPKHETLHDIELGTEIKRQQYQFGGNLFYMNYHNQLVLTGKINDVGAYTRQNIPQSYRLGVELQGGIRLSDLMNVSANLALSKNKIKNFTEYIDDYDNGKQLEINHKDVDISFSPAVIGGATFQLSPVRNFSVDLISKYVSRQYLDNTQDDARSLQPYYLQDVKFAYVLRNKLFKEWNIIARVNNVFNKKYEPNGYTFSYVYNNVQSTENYYFPMAGTNVLVALNIKL